MNVFKELLSQIYPQHVDTILSALSYALPTDSKPTKPPSDWYKNINLYVTYGDSFCSNGTCTLDVLSSKLEELHYFGITALHVLPPFTSPLIDGGFDVSDYYTIRPELGGNEAFDRLLSKANELRIRVFIDLVFNHVSEQHEWFVKAQAGDEYYRNFFIYSQNAPKLLDIFVADGGPWARYEIDGRQQTIRIIFPEQAGDIPHWIKGKDGYWYYHTFYPHQIDVDWNNPMVFTEYCHALIYWAKKGLSFRLDAIPFVGKDVKNGVMESTEKTHQIIQTLHQVMKIVSSESIFLVEACQPLDTTKKYFGTTKHVEAELAYNFHLMSALWASIISYDISHIWKALKETQSLPHCGQWITFLRNHDDLTLEFPEEEIRLLLYNALVDKGLVFKKNFGVAGKTVAFLDGNPLRHIMVHLLLASLPGCPAIIFGDEIGKGNDHEFMSNQTSKKRLVSEDKKIVDDPRDINRSPITDKDWEKQASRDVFMTIAMILKARQRFPEMATTMPEFIPCQIPRVFSCRYTFKDKDLIIYINLTDTTYDLSSVIGDEAVLEVNWAHKNDTSVTLPPYAGIWLVKQH